VWQLSKSNSNIWEAAWCGNTAVAAVVSPGPGESLWYDARLQVIDIESGRGLDIYSPNSQLGWPAASPSGKHLAIVEALCSDRWIVAGDLRLIDTASAKTVLVDTHGVDITCTEWRSDTLLLLAGHRGLTSVIGLYDVSSRTFTEVWESKDISAGVRYISVAGLGEAGDCVLIGESFIHAPQIAVIRQGRYESVKSFDLRPADNVDSNTAVEEVAWKAPDGREIQGWLLRPRGKGPHPLVMQIHGGPVWIWHPTWLGRGLAHIPMLIQRGFAVFFPNPRGSAGRGQEFIKPIVGDMGGADTYDYLSGLDHLVEEGIADPARLGVTGVSYGGFMSAWLITQDSRFAAAVPVAPVTNYVTEHLVSNLPRFVSIFLADTYNNPNGRYFQRSPIMHAHKVKTPTLNICGALDRCTPPEEALQFHNALLENAVKSVLVSYPQEGHGIRKWPAAIDYAARVVGWFEEHMPPANGRSG
jgi:dipeptidyl aminopeptidase/acylaminoacyl peptidase